jgi:hypothetical protein
MLSEALQDTTRKLLLQPSFFCFFFVLITTSSSTTITSTKGENVDGSTYTGCDCFLLGRAVCRTSKRPVPPVPDYDAQLGGEPVLSLCNRKSATFGSASPCKNGIRWSLFMGPGQNESQLYCSSKLLLFFQHKFYSPHITSCQHDQV